MTKQLTGKIAIVTGGSRGIGRGIAERYIMEGAAVVVGSRSEPADMKGDAIWLKVDVSQAQDVERMVAETVAKFGRIDILVNNAGVQLEKKIVDTSDEEWEWLSGVNMKGVFLCARHVIPIMQQQGAGVIINIGSISATHADPNLAIYNASKAFVHGLTRSIAVDHGRDGIRCNAICPGWIMTEIADQAFDQADDPEKARAMAIAQHPVGRMGTPADIASIATWLACDEASFATGQFFTVDGGLTAQSPINPALF